MTTDFPLSADCPFIDLRNQMGVYASFMSEPRELSDEEAPWELTEPPEADNFHPDIYTGLSIRNEPDTVQRTICEVHGLPLNLYRVSYFYIKEEFAHDAEEMQRRCPNARPCCVNREGRPSSDSVPVVEALICRRCFAIQNKGRHPFLRKVG